jgi:hypothetical protein
MIKQQNSNYLRACESNPRSGEVISFEEMMAQVAAQRRSEILRVQQEREEEFCQQYGTLATLFPTTIHQAPYIPMPTQLPGRQTSMAHQGQPVPLAGHPDYVVAPHLHSVARSQVYSATPAQAQGSAIQQPERHVRRQIISDEQLTMSVARRAATQQVVDNHVSGAVSDGQGVPDATVDTSSPSQDGQAEDVDAEGEADDDFVFGEDGLRSSIESEGATAIATTDASEETSDCEWEPRVRKACEVSIVAPDSASVKLTLSIRCLPMIHLELGLLCCSQNGWLQCWCHWMQYS